MTKFFFWGGGGFFLPFLGTLCWKSVLSLVSFTYVLTPHSRVYMDVWMCGCVDVWMCGCVCGCMYVRMFVSERAWTTAYSLQKST